MITSMPILVLYPHGRCNCRCLMCDIWKSTDSREMSRAEIERHLSDIDRLGVKWIVLSGGEPLMHSDLFRLCEPLQERGIRITLLSTGLLIERHARAIVRCMNDVIVSLDGPPALHDRIRRVPGAFEQLRYGVNSLLQWQPNYSVSARSTVQRLNCGSLCETAHTAKALHLKSISFLAVDVTSSAFNRADCWNQERQESIALTKDQLPILRQQIEQLTSEWEGTGFVQENREKLERVVRHFEAYLGLTEPVSPPCNAPWVSAVIETDGQVRPCYFHPPIGHLSGNSLIGILNGPQAVTFRASLDVQTNPVCKRCVCSLNVRAAGA